MKIINHNKIKIPFDILGQKIFKQSFRNFNYYALEKNNQKYLVEYSPLKNFVETYKYGFNFSCSLAREIKNNNITPKISNKKIFFSALIPNMTAKESLLFTNKLLCNGYTTIKIKVGSLSLKEEIIRIEKILTKHPAINLRIDANNKFTLEQAKTFIQNTNCKNIEVYEELMPRGEKLTQFLLENNYPYALDVSEQDFLQEDFLKQKFSHLVIKPARFSSVLSLLYLAFTAKKSGKEIILSTCFESSYFSAQICLLNIFYNLSNYPAALFCPYIFTDKLILPSSLSVKQCQKIIKLYEDSSFKK